jgi:general secretion pathway protein D
VCLLAILVVVVAYVILSSHQPTSAPATQLFVEPETIRGTTGQDLTLNVSISNVADLYGWEFYLGWNPSLLSLVSVNEGPFLKSGGNTYFYFLNSTNEYVRVDCTLEGEIPGVSGDGTLATVTFSTTNAGQCQLNLYNVDLRDSSDAQIPCQAISGYGYFSASAALLLVEPETVQGTTG